MGLNTGSCTSLKSWLMGWSHGLCDSSADEVLARRFRARQLQALFRLTPLLMMGNLLNVVLVASTFWSADRKLFLVLWSGAIAAIATRSLLRWWQRRAQPAQDEASARALLRTTQVATLIAALWAVMPPALFVTAGTEEQLLAGTVATGMICAGAFALATLPVAGTVYVVVLGLGTGVALVLSDLRLVAVITGLLVLYCLIVIANIWSSARMFAARMMAEVEAERQNELIGLLLRDFEENSSDLLWELGADGCLLHPSIRLAHRLGLTQQALETTPLLQLLAPLVPDDDEAQGQLATLRLRLQRGVPFRDQALAAVHADHAHWWSLSAKPVLDHSQRVCGWRGVATDITAARNAHQQLNWLAHNDALTGLGNRHQFRSQLASRLTSGQHMPLAVLCIDLDHFKWVNDTLGHAVGDTLLSIIGARLAAVTRRQDMVSRLGGDEFAVLLPVIDPTETEATAQRLLDALRVPCEVKGSQLVAHASIGIAMAPQDGHEVDTLLNCADLALYAAKAAGRNEYRFFSPDMAVSMRRRLAIEQGLREALQHERLWLVFQPQIDLERWSVVGFETLLRWEHPELGEVMPAEFIPIAEEAGLMPAIGDWVLAAACRQAVDWPESLTLSVNVSTVQALAPNFVQNVREHAQATGLPLQRLELEITESVFLQQTPSIANTLQRLHQAGVRIALDDFGTGYSALAYLRQFPFDTLKIDRSFVLELATRSSARDIVKMILGLARSLNMRTVAEGVEESAHASMLQSFGCELLQGYLVSRPILGDQISSFLAAWPSLPRPALATQALSESMQLNAAA